MPATRAARVVLALWAIGPLCSGARAGQPAEHAGDGPSRPRRPAAPARRPAAPAGPSRRPARPRGRPAAPAAGPPAGRRGYAAEGALKVIVTGFEHTGTTVVSEVIMSAPDVYGPFECGFLLAETPRKFRHVGPFFKWSGADFEFAAQNEHLPYLRLSSRQQGELLAQPTHAAMYDYVMKAAPLMANATGFVDKTPRYSRDLVAVMRRSPGVPVVLVTKTYEHMYSSAKKRTPQEFKAWQVGYPQFKSSVAAARREFGHRLFEVSYESLFVNLCERDRTARALFRFLKLPYDPAYFSCAAIRKKRESAQLCARHESLPSNCPGT